MGVYEGLKLSIDFIEKVERDGDFDDSETPCLDGFTLFEKLAFLDSCGFGIDIPDASIEEINHAFAYIAASNSYPVTHNSDNGTRLACSRGGEELVYYADVSANLSYNDCKALHAAIMERG